MGGFRKFMPFTAFGDGRRVARDRRRPAAVGLLLQGRDHQPGVPRRRLRALDRRARRRRVHRGLHDPPDLPHVLRQRALRQPDDATPSEAAARRGRRARHAADDLADSDPSPTVSLRRRRSPAPLSRAPAARVAAGPWCSRSSCSPCSPRSAGFINLPFTELEWLRRVARAVVPRGARRAARHLRRRLRRSRCSSVAIALVGILFAYALYRQRPRATATRPARRASSGRSRPCSATRTTTTTGISEARRRPGPRASRGWLDRVSTTKIIDGTVNGVGSLVRSSPRRGVHQCRRARAPVRARHRPRCRRPAPLRRHLAGPVAVDFPILSVHPVTPFVGAVICLLHAGAPPRARQGGRLRHHGGHASASRAWLLWHFRHAARHVPVRREPALDPRASASATSSASTASASS